MSGVPAEQDNETTDYDNKAGQRAEGGGQSAAGVRLARLRRDTEEQRAEGGGQE
jgi:hypothetical protein